MLEHKMVYKCTWYQATSAQRSIIDFVVMSSDLQPQLGSDRGRAVIWSPPGGELEQLAGGGLPDRPGKPKRVVRVNWERLVEAPVREVFN